MLQQLQDSLKSHTWTDAAVRDTISAIVQDPAYRRDIAQSLWGKFARWFWDSVNRFLDSLSGSPGGRIIVFVLLGLAIALIIARIVIGVQAERAAKLGSRRPHLQGTSVSLADAERLAGGGDYTAAAHALFSSLLIAGAQQGQFRVHPSKTTGDYARELRRKSAQWLRPFQSFRSRYDRVIYGDMHCTAEDYGALLNDARTMLMRDKAA
ncbi:MAG: DUF4129 domain-containing protein [Gemmatimonadaceae bacterium]